jgi:hypothetical protein
VSLTVHNAESILRLVIDLANEEPPDDRHALWDVGKLANAIVEKKHIGQEELDIDLSNLLIYLTCPHNRGFYCAYMDRTQSHIPCARVHEVLEHINTLIGGSLMEAFEQRELTMAEWLTLNRQAQFTIVGAVLKGAKSIERPCPPPYTPLRDTRY